MAARNTPLTEHLRDSKLSALPNETRAQLGNKMFDGLHLVCLMYAGFKIIIPDRSIGFDLNKGYDAAKKMQSSEDEAG